MALNLYNFYMTNLLKNKTFKYCISVFVSTVLIAFLILETQRQWTRVPSVQYTIPAGSVQEKLSQGTSIYTYLHNWSTFAYFTTLSNFIFIIPYAYCSIMKKKMPNNIKLAFMTYLLITFVVFWTSIAPFLPWGQSSYFDFISVYEHSFPLIICVMWLMTSERKKEKPSWLILMVYPIIYLVFTLIFSIAINFDVAVYPFLNFTNWFGLDLNVYLSVFLTIISILVCAIGILFIYWILNKIYLKFI